MTFTPQTAEEALNRLTMIAGLLTTAIIKGIDAQK